MEHEIKVIFSDIDGTLLNQEHRITKKTVTAIRKIKEKNLQFVLASSRGPMAIEPILNRYDFTCPMVSFGGALILDEDKNILHEEPLAFDDVVSLIRYLEKEKLPTTWNIYTSKNWYVKDCFNPLVRKEANIVEVEPILCPPYFFHNKVDVDKILLMCDSSKIIDIEKELKYRFPYLMITKSSQELIEITKGEVSKAKGIMVFLDKMNFSLKNAMAFGDNFNDEEMLSIVSYPILMDNAPIEMKKKGYYLTKDNNHDGIEEALIHYHLLSD